MAPRRTTPKGYERARQLRKELTLAEHRIWACLRGDKLRGVNFRRQHAIRPYIVDFCSIKQKLIIELDGSQHLEQDEYDAERTAFFVSRGYCVLRFWNSELMNDLESVLRAIAFALEENRKPD